jgi:hypothetical protein
MVKLACSISLLFLLTACTQLPGYDTPVRVEEGGDEWEVRLVRALVSDTSLAVELEYTNHRGASFTVRPDNVIITDQYDNRWVAVGRRPYIPLVAEGRSHKAMAIFENVALGTQALYLHPFHRLSHDDPKILLKRRGKIPLPGEFTSGAWDVIQ